MDTATLRVRIKDATYDKMYQDIECLGMEGYSKSSLTWNTIKNCVPWSVATVADLGCFHGYFSFKAAKLGAKVVGFDRSEEILVTARMINELEGTNVEFKKWEAGELIPASFNVVLCLNVLHHFKDPELSLQRIESKKGIFEVERKQLALVKKYFKEICIYPSHRAGRLIMLGERI